MPSEYTPGELVAARLLVHRLTCEFAGIEYEDDPAGVSWALRDSVIVLTDDEGRETTLGDLMYATLSILVPLVATVASLDPDESVPLDIVQAIGLGVAQSTTID